MIEESEVKEVLPYKQPMSIILIFAFSCLRTKKMAKGTAKAKPKIKEEAVTMD